MTSEVLNRAAAIAAIYRSKDDGSVHGAFSRETGDALLEMAAEIERLTARAEAAEAILADAGALRDAAGRVSEWFCTEARDHEGPRINALRMAMIAYGRHMQPAPHAAMKEGR